MKSSCVFFLVLLSTTSVFPMKRTSTGQESSTKRIKIIPQKTMYLSNFFATHARLQHLCIQSKIDTDIVDTFPREIKNLIAAKKVYNNDCQEWWYQSATKFDFPNNYTHSLAFSPDNTLVVGLRNGTIRFINLDDNTQATIKVADSAVSALTYSPDGSLFAYAIDKGITIVTSETITLNDPHAIFTHKGERNVWAALEDVNLGVFVHATGLGGGGSPARHPAHDDDSPGLS